MTSIDRGSWLKYSDIRTGARVMRGCLKFLSWMSAILFVVSLSAQHPDPRIAPPHSNGETVIYVRDFLEGSERSAWKAFRNALLKCKETNASRLVIPKGRYVFDDPEILKSGAHLVLEELNDLVIDGGGSEFVFHFIRHGVEMIRCRRVVLRNFSVDWDVELASPGVVEEAAGGGKVIRIAPEFPVTSDTKVGAVTEFDVASRRWKMNPVEVYNPRDVHVLAPQVLASPSFAAFTGGMAVLVRHHIYDACAFVFNEGNGDLAFEDIAVYAAPGMAWQSKYAERGFRFTRCSIRPKPGSNRLISVSSDGIFFGAARGGILIEDCEFTGQGDDSINIHGEWTTVASRKDPVTLEISYKWGNAPPPFSKGDKLRFYGRDTLQVIGSATVEGSERKGKFASITVDRDLPKEVQAGDFVHNMNRDCRGFVIRNNDFHDHRARGMLLKASDGLVERNRIRRVMAAGISVTTDVTHYHEGSVCENISIRDNLIEDCNEAVWERGPEGRHMAALNVLADLPSGLSKVPVHRGIQIENNTIRNTPGLAILIASAEDVEISGNTIIDANTGPFGNAGAAIDASARGAIMITRARKVTLSGNERTETNASGEPMIHLDPRNTTDVRF